MVVVAVAVAALIEFFIISPPLRSFFTILGGCVYIYNIVGLYYYTHLAVLECRDVVILPAAASYRVFFDN